MVSVAICHPPHANADRNASTRVSAWHNPIDELVAAMGTAGFDPGRISAMSRVKPDGKEISWRLTRAAGARPDEGALPERCP